MMLDRQTDLEEAVRRAWAPAVQPLALHLVCGAAGLGSERLVPPAPYAGLLAVHFVAVTKSV